MRLESRGGSARLSTQAARRTTRMPHAAPEENSSSASTSSTHPRKWRSGSSSVHPSTASRVARSEGVRRRRRAPRGGAPPPRPQGLLRTPSPCDESVAERAAAARRNALKLGFRVPSNVDQARLPAVEALLVAEQEPEEDVDARVPRTYRHRLRQVRRLLRPGDADDPVGWVRLVAVLRDPEPHAACRRAGRAP